MKPTLPNREKLQAAGGAPDACYAAWKQAKIKKGLAQSADRAAIIPIEQVWRDLKLER